jgi:uncharacterized Zn finger protein (UPF0148 family)
MPDTKPKYMLLYKCSACGMDSGFLENEEAYCRYCDSPSEMQLASKQEITPELMKQRLDELSNRMMSSLQAAFESMNEEDKSSFPTGIDAEEEMLLLLAKAKKLQDTIRELEMDEPDPSSSTNEDE